MVDGRVFIKALRPIDAGEELFYDYRLVIDERYTPALKKQFACRCGAETCRGTMLAPKRPAPPHEARCLIPASQWGAEALWEQLHDAAAGPQRRDRRQPAVDQHDAARARPRQRRGRRTPRQCTRREVRRSVESGAFGRRAADWQPCLLVAEQQTAGRGRHGPRMARRAARLADLLARRCRWRRPTGRGCRWRSAWRWPRRSIHAARRHAPRIGIKWPNDLWLLDADVG